MTTPQAAAALRMLSLLAQHPDLPAPARWSIDEHCLTGWFLTGTTAEANAAMTPWALVAGVEKVRVGAAVGGRTLWSVRWARGTGWVQMAMYCKPTTAWRQVDPDRHERLVDGVLWGIDDLDDTEIGPDDPGPGWYLYGPGPFAGGRFLVASDSVPTAGADAVIRTHTYLGTSPGGTARHTCDCCGRVGEVRNMAGIRLCVGNTTGLAGPCPPVDEVTA